MALQTDVRKLLVLRGPALEAQGILELLGERFQVEVAEELDDALAALRENNYDAVLAETADFLPLERGVVTQQASVVLETLGDGVCVVGPRGEMVWANRRLRQFPTEILDKLRSSCLKVYEQFALRHDGESLRARRFSLMPPDGGYFEVICSPVRDRSGALRMVAAVVVDATHQRRQQQKLNAIDRAGRELVRLDDDARTGRTAEQRLKTLEERIIRYSRVLNYQHFAVLLLDEKTNRLEMIFSQGLDADAGAYELFASTDGNGICGYVAATGRSYICPDVRKDPRYLVGLATARSSLTVPLRLRDKVIGVLNVEVDAVGAFSEEDRQFAEIFANYIAVALHMLNLLVFERHSATTQASGSLAAEMAGPLNDIITDATELMEDYIGHDDLRKRLHALIDLAGTARKRMQQLVETQAAGGVLAPQQPPAAHDPLLAGKRVLVADDEDLIRQTIHDVLVCYGCSVDLSADGGDAIEKITANPYDLIITDIKMPLRSGYKVFRAARELRPQTPVIFITAFGYDPGHTVVKANREGLAAVLMKPFKAHRLLEECRSALAPQQG